MLVTDFTSSLSYTNNNNSLVIIFRLLSYVAHVKRLKVSTICSQLICSIVLCLHTCSRWMSLIKPTLPTSLFTLSYIWRFSRSATQNRLKTTRGNLSHYVDFMPPHSKKNLFSSSSYVAAVQPNKPFVCVCSCDIDERKEKKKNLHNRETLHVFF